VSAGTQTGEKPTIEVKPLAADGTTVVLRGEWSLWGLRRDADRLRDRVRPLVEHPDVTWDLTGVTTLDQAGAFELWTWFGRRAPERLRVRPEHEALLTQWERRRAPEAIEPPERRSPWARLSTRLRQIGRQQLDFFALIGFLAYDLAAVTVRPWRAPWREISQTVHDAGGRALAVTALVGGLIGVVLAYLTALQLKTLGAEEYMVDVLGLGVIRELGPLLAAIVVAGRSGSAMTAQLGVMRVTKELDAYSAMGVSHTRRLVLPKVIALVIALPLLAVWTDLIALAGGIVAATLALGIGAEQFLVQLPTAVPLVNYFIGLGKAAVFGLMIALTAGHFGLRIQPDTQSLSRETTNAVVVAITFVILMDAIFAVVFQGVGMPL
jgi:phospholipid/cholesterol/gamma-HCH transport system permease protein